MIEKPTSTLTLLTNDNDGIIALMRSLGIYEQMLLAQTNRQDVMLVQDDYAFIWSVDTYILYQSNNPEELKQVVLDFQKSARELEIATRH